MVRLDQRAVSDVMVVAFMFILLAMAAAFVFDITTRQLEASADRQLGLKSLHLHQTLKLSAVGTYPHTALEAAAHQIVVDEPVVPDDYLRSWLENTLDYILPQGYGVTLELTHENGDWALTYPSGAEVEKLLPPQMDNISIAENRETPIVVGVQTRMFKIA